MDTRLRLMIVLACVLPVACDRSGTGDGLGDAPPAIGTRAQTPSAVVDEALVTDATSVAGSLSVMSAGGPGDYIVDSNHRAVYLLRGDTDGSGCTGSCLKTWAPVFAPTAPPSAGQGIAPVLVGTLQRGDGSTQVTYNGHPLYHYAGDTAVGSTAGHGVAGRWYLVTPQGEPLGEPVAMPGSAPADAPSPPQAEMGADAGRGN